MANNPSDPRQQYASTYFVQDRSNQEEMTRLAVQDRMITSGMGGVLPEQPASSRFSRVLDVGCGTGGWLIELAKTSPETTRLFGIDANHYMLEYAREQAKAAQVYERIEFHTMDALLILEFPQQYFDLVNMRFATPFMRTWDWPKLLTELLRVTRPGGVIRFTEYERITSNCQALLLLLQMAGNAFYRAGHLFAEGQTGATFSECTIGVAHDLERLLRQYGIQDVQTHRSAQECSSGSPGSESFAEDLRLGLRTIIPFLRKWGCLTDDYDTLYQEMLAAMQRPDYVAGWSLITAWGNKEL